MRPGLDSAGRKPADLVLRPYQPQPNRDFPPRLFIGLVLFCLVYGFAYAVFAPFLILQFTIPILFLGILVIWLLPAGVSAPVRTLELFFCFYFASLAVWPNYLAVAIPGLPWFTLQRLFSYPLFLFLLTCLSVSKDFRSQLVSALDDSPLIWKSIAVFVAIQFVSIGFSANLPQSLNQFVVTQVTWTAIFFTSCYLFVRPGRAESWAFMIWLMAIFVGLIAVPEYWQNQVFWADHIPSFLKIENEAIARTLSGAFRTGTDRYRVQSTFTHPLTLAEFIVLALPFILHFVAGAFNRFVKIAALLSIPFLIFIVKITDARLGMVAIFLSFLLYPFMWAVIRWIRRRDSIFGPAIALGYPVAFGIVLGAILSVYALYARVFGDGSTVGSTNARVEQYQLAFPKILSQPWGYGIGRAGETLGYRLPSGMFTIDAYYLSVILEYGLLGFAVYYGILLLAVYKSGRHALTAPESDREYALLIPLSIALTNFIVIKSVFSQQDNHPIIYMMLGMVVAIVHRIRSSGKHSHSAGLT